MAVPKRKKSKAKRDARRTHQKTEGLTTTTCSQCGEPKLPHHACPECGDYRGKTVINIEEEE